MAEHVFVYGTLKTGQCRQTHWPHKPLQIQKAWTLGRLYDTGPFPAMIHGTDRVAGQVWTFNAAELPETLRVLDRIEGTNQAGFPNDYDREKVPTTLVGGGALPACTYIFAKTELLSDFTYLPPTLEVDGQHYAIWPPSSRW